MKPITWSCKPLAKGFMITATKPVRGNIARVVVVIPIDAWDHSDMPRLQQLDQCTAAAATELEWMAQRLPSIH